MAFIYSASGEKIELVYSSDDIGVNLENNEVATTAVRQVKAATRASRSAKPSKAAAPSSSRFGRIVLLKNAEAGASRNSFSTVREAFSRSVTQKVKRALPVFIEPQSGLRLVTTREITVRFKSGTKGQTIKKLLNDYGLEIRRTSEFDPRKHTLVPKRDVDELLTLDLANALSELTDDVSFANPNFVAEYRKTALPTDPLLKQQWHLENTGQNGGLSGEDVDALLAWNITAGSPDVVVAIVDDGVDIKHPDLEKNIWRNPDPKAKDKNGRNFYDENFDPRPRYFQAPYNELSGNDIHGTPCAGVVAATSSKGGGVGIAHESKILPVKIFGGDNLARNDQVADAIRYAGLHAQVVSCSWSGPPNADLEAAINDVALAGRGGKGTLVFCATGNDENDTISFPAKHKLAFAIGASNDQGVRSQYSNYGEGLDFVAPSSDYDRQGITTTDVSYNNRGFNLKSSYTDDFGGTSSATPLAAGVAALMLSVNPSLSRDEVYEILVRSSDKIDKKNGGYKKGYSNQYGYGRVNAYNAVTLAQEKLDKSQDIILEAITFGVKGKTKTTAQLKKELFGNSKNWKLEKVENSKTSFDAIYIGKEPLPVKDAWELVYQLRSNKNISYAEPSFLIPDPKATDFPGEKSSSKRASFLTGDHDPKTNTDFEWNLAQAGVQKAWELIPPTGGKQQGEGIVIGHPDSGYRQHPELDEARVLAAKGYDFYDDDEIEEDLDGNHGLGTGSVIMSGRNQLPDKPYVTGAAPKAELVPFRVTAKRGIIPAPVLLCGGMQKLRKAINYIVDKKECHVISMSLGGLPYEPVREAIQRAVNEGIIVLAAAGNVVSFVVWPAAYHEVLALAACDVNGKPWRWTAFGSAVDATAPGHSVWRATITDKGEKTVERSSGTSFAVATTAGIAALWLAFHGRDNLIAKYGKAGISEAFRKVLISTCQPSSALNPAKHGAGIVDAKKVLEAPLPAAPGVRSVAKANLKKPLSKLDVLAQMFDGVPRESVRQGLGDLLKARGKTLDNTIEEVGDELAFQFLVDQDSYDAFRKSLESRARGAKASGAGGIAKVREKLAIQNVSQQLGSRL